MPKPQSEELFELIKSMSASEKRYFKMNGLSNNEDSKYAKLFEQIESQGHINSDKEIDYITPGQLPNLKANLYKKILQSLRRFHFSSSVDTQIREMIDYAHLLFNRSQYKQCASQLKKAKALAQKSDNPELLLVILKWQKNVVLQTANGDSRKLVKGIIEEARDVNHRINNINKFTNIQLELNALYQQIGFIRNAKDHERVQRIFQSSMPSLKEELSINEKFSLYSLYINYYFFIQDFERGYLFAKKWISLFDNPILIRTKLESYIQALNSLMIAQSRLGLYHEFAQTKRRFRRIRFLHNVVFTENINKKLFKYSYVHEFNGLFMRGHFTDGVRMFERIKPDLEAFYYDALDAHSRLVMFYKIACLYIGDSNFGEALYWLNRIINSESADLREDVHGFARILSLICHYELGNQDVIDYYIRSTYRFLLKKKNLQLYQKYILNFLRRLGSVRISNEEMIIRFQILRSQLLPLESNPYEKRAFIYFDIISWLESKIEDRPVQDIIREKADKQIKAVEELNV